MIRALTAGALFAVSGAAPAEAQSTAPDPFKGAGAALCIAAGEALAASPGGADTSDTVAAWRQILHVMDGSDERRAAAIGSARESVAHADTVRSGMSLVMARSVWSSTCTDRNAQVRYIAVHASEERAELNLADEPDRPIGADAALRLNLSASCGVAAELFLRKRPSSRLRATFRSATPALLDGARLAEIRGRAHVEVDRSAGAAAGKALVVDYLRYLYDTAASGESPQTFVNTASRLIADRCVSGANEDGVHG